MKRLFKPEFVNRIDEMIVFHPLNKENLKEIVSIMLKAINKRTRQQMGIDLHVSEEGRSFLIEKGFDEKYGARPLRRTLQSQVEDRLAEKILEGEVREGDQVEITKVGDNLEFLLKAEKTLQKQ